MQMDAKDDDFGIPTGLELMAAGDTSITISGFPSALNSVKLKLLLERRAGRGLIEDVKRQNDGPVKLKFSNDEDLLTFKAANITEIPFGDEMHLLTVLNVTQRGSGTLPRRSPPLMSVPTTLSSTGRGQAGPRRTTGIVGDVRQVQRLQMAPRRQQTNPQNLNQPGLDLSLYSEVHYWSNFKELPAEGGTLCVLAQNIDGSTHIQTVKMHFESKKRSNGGLVESIIKMIDGLLIVFQDAEDCESCLEMKDQTFDEKNLVIFRKKIPTYFERKFVVEGVGSSTSADTLAMFLESCSANETSPTACKKQAIPGVYLIEYGEDFDTEEEDEILKNIQKQPLENKHLKASKLLRTDCLKVTGVQDDVSSDSVRLKFESKKRTDGGPVTRVDRLENKAILVYFADFTDAERVYERFKKPSDESIIIGQYPVEVELYFHSLANDHKNIVKQLQTDKFTGSGEEGAAAGPKRPLRNYDLQPGCDEKILFFLKNNQTHSKKLEDAFKEIASVEIVTEKKGNSKPAMKFLPKKKTGGETQKTFNEECKKQLDVFLSDYASVSPTFDKSKLQKARAAKLSPLHDKTYKGDGENIAVSWKADSVEVTGLKDAVNSLVDELKMSLELTEKRMSTNVEQYRLMVSCGIVEELRQNHTSVNIKCDDQTQSIILTGPSDDVNTVQINALTILNTIEKKKLSGIDGIILRYLAEVVKDSLDVQMQLQDKFKTDGVKAALSTDGDNVYIRVRTEADYKRACDSINQLIAIKNISLDDASAAIINTPLWKGFQHSIKEMGPVRVYTKQWEAILVVGIRSDLQPLLRKIMDFLDDNATRRFCIGMSYGSSRFIIEKSKEFSQDACRNEGIRCELTSDDGGGVYVEGNKKSLDKARPRMVQLTQTIAEKQHTLTEPGIKQYYEGEEGKDFLKMTERANNCIILPTKRTCLEWEREARSSRQMLERGPVAVQTPQEQLFISVKLPKSLVTLQVWKTNIIEHKCDVIINASNPQLQLLPGGISGVIGKLDSESGDVIQSAMRRLLRENHGDFLSGDAVITTAGNLKSCKKIVHAVVPRWNTISGRDPSNSLKSCIFKSLEEASGARMTSIAIPAISCGVFGGKVNVCVPLIVETVVEYFQEDTNSTIQRVDFVENAKDDILAVFENCVQKYQDSVPNESLGDEKFDLFFYSTEVESINRAYEAIKRETRKMFHSQVMQDDSFGRFSEWEWWELKEVAIEKEVKISNKSNKYLKQILIEGLMRNVLRANEAVRDILKDFCEAETTTTYVTWQKMVHGAWEDYQPRSANTLEKAFKTRNGDNTNPKLNRITVPEYRGHRVHTTTVDLSNLEGGISGKNPPTVRRRLNEKVETDVLPSHWNPIPSQHPYSKEPLERSSQEYQTVYPKYTQISRMMKARNGNNTNPKLNRIRVPEYRSRWVHTTTLDLSNLEIDVSGKPQTNVRRKVKEKVEADTLPTNWDPIPSQQPYSKVALQQNSQEYKTVYQTFTHTGGCGTVIKIERIQNVSLYKQFVAKKAEVTKKMQNNGNPVSRQLFHGTADDDKIMLNGFDRSYAGKNATAFGRGVYFAINASYSNGYAVANQQGQRRMFLADVVTGDFTTGSSSYVAPPPRQSAIRNDLYDSVVNNVANPSIFVIFKDSSAYPSYLITYQ